jgi:GNAT superfamily N-acetyltransferase
LSPVRALAKVEVGPVEVGPVELGLYVNLRRAVDPLALVSVEDQLHHAAENEAPLWLLAEDEGRPVGYGFGSFWKGEPKDFMPANWGVLPEARGRGHGAALYAALAAHAGEHGASELQASADDVGRAWLERRGFRLIDTLEQIVLDVHDAPPAEPLPDGVELTTYLERPDLGRALHAIVEEGLQDIPGGLAELGFPYESWLADRDVPSRRPEFLHIALVDGEPAGYASLNLYGDAAFNGFTVVARRFRRRGLARVLKLAQIEDARRAGIKRLITQSNEDNAAMRALNAELGYRPAKPLFVLRGPA